MVKKYLCSNIAISGDIWDPHFDIWDIYIIFWREPTYLDIWDINILMVHIVWFVRGAATGLDISYWEPTSLMGPVQVLWDASRLTLLLYHKHQPTRGRYTIDGSHGYLLKKSFHCPYPSSHNHGSGTIAHLETKHIFQDLTFHFHDYGRKGNPPYL